MAQHITLGGGCFWCLDAAYRLVGGVKEVVCGYAGGHVSHPTYDMLHSQDTGHAEVVRLTFDDTVIDLTTVLEIFWVIHDPTTLNRQGNDVGPQYRSIILYTSEVQKGAIDASIADAQKLWTNPIVTEVEPLEVFYEAEPEHQNYFAKHPESGYCQVIINPKLHKLQQKFAMLLR